jgi:hypothetical protein
VVEVLAADKAVGEEVLVVGLVAPVDKVADNSQLHPQHMKMVRAKKKVTLWTH